MEKSWTENIAGDSPMEKREFQPKKMGFLKFWLRIAFGSKKFEILKLTIKRAALSSLAHQINKSTLASVCRKHRESRNFKPKVAFRPKVGKVLFCRLFACRTIFWQTIKRPGKREKCAVHIVNILF